MTPMLYWTVYHLELGRLDPKVHEVGVEPRVRRQPLGSVTALHLQPDAGIDERM
jgi:hypothetical protein